MSYDERSSSRACAVGVRLASALPIEVADPPLSKASRRSSARFIYTVQRLHPTASGAPSSPRHVRHRLRWRSILVGCRRRGWRCGASRRTVRPVSFWNAACVAAQASITAMAIMTPWPVRTASWPRDPVRWLAVRGYVAVNWSCAKDDRREVDQFRSAPCLSSFRRNSFVFFCSSRDPGTRCNDDKCLSQGSSLVAKIDWCSSLDLGIVRTLPHLGNTERKNDRQLFTLGFTAPLVPHNLCGRSQRNRRQLFDRLTAGIP